MARDMLENGLATAETLGNSLRIEREHARQPLIADLIELRAQLKAAEAKLQAVLAAMAIPDGHDHLHEVDVMPYVLVETLRKAIEP